MAEGAELKSENWVMVVSEQHRYQGVSYKSDIIVISGLDPGDRQVLEYKYSGCDPPCLLDSSNGRFVLKGPCYNPMDVINALMTRRGYKVTGSPQQRTLPNIHNKDDKFALIYHLSKQVPVRKVRSPLSREDPSNVAALHHSRSLSTPSESPQDARQSTELLNTKKLRFSPQPGGSLRKIQHPFYSNTVEY